MRQQHPCAATLILPCEVTLLPCYTTHSRAATPVQHILLPCDNKTRAPQHHDSRANQCAPVPLHPYYKICSRADTPVLHNLLPCQYTRATHFATVRRNTFTPVQITALPCHCTRATTFCSRVTTPVLHIWLPCNCTRATHFAPVRMHPCYTFCSRATTPVLNHFATVSLHP